MSRFAEAARERVRVARARLVSAQEAGNATEEAEAADELDDALRKAREYGVEPAEGP
ncbi:hypothetical protein [Streptomyces sp. NPDC006879]|uniref:hypothetical protein n=1 Tax=Streptomyces sp. NPDC006879 TaxID=3364767 RepID=UPI00368D6AF8